MTILGDSYDFHRKLALSSLNLKSEAKLKYLKFRAKNRRLQKTYCNRGLRSEKAFSVLFFFFSPYASVGESNSNSLTRKGRFNISTGGDSSNSLTRKGRFRVKRVRSASIDEGRADSKEQSPSIISLGNNTSAYTYKATTNPK